MPSNDRCKHRNLPPSTKLPKIKTINDLLTRDDINRILQNLDKRKPDITDMIVIYYNKDTDTYGWQITADTKNFFAVGLLTAIIQDLLISEDAEDD